MFTSKRLRYPAIVFLVGIGITLLLVFLLHLNQLNQNDKAFAIKAKHYFDVFESLLERDFNLIGAASDFYYSTNEEQWPQFVDFAPRILSRSQSLIALEWMEKIPNSEIQIRAVELKDRFSFFEAFTVVNRVRTTDVVGQQDHKFMVTDIVPRSEGNLKLLGFFGYQERFWDAVNNMILTGQPSVSDKVRLLQDGMSRDYKKTGLLVYYPVFEHDKKELKGIVIGVIRVTSYMEELVSSLNLKQSLYFNVVDDGFDAENEIIYETDNSGADYYYQFEKSMQLPNREWSVQIKSNIALAPAQKVALFVVMISGGLASILLAGVSFYQVNEQTLIEGLLSKRTKELDFLAKRDSLTGLFNRREFDRQLELYELSKQPYSLMFIDLDNFKVINDTYGHAVGDLALQTVKARLLACLPQRANLFRVGGDELALLVDVKNDHEIRDIANACCVALNSEPIKYQGNLIPLTLSIGAAMWQYESAELLRSKVDKALYQAKHNGKNQVILAHEC